MPGHAVACCSLGSVSRLHDRRIVGGHACEVVVRNASGEPASFDWIVTAQQARSYKPSSANFLLALERIGQPRDRVLHVAQSLYHDIAPANALGLATVWVNRRQGRSGHGATPAAVAKPDLEVPDLQSLARAAGLM